MNLNNVGVKLKSVLTLFKNRARLLCETFQVQMENGYISLVKARQFPFGELKDYIEESNEEVTLGRVLS